LSIYPDSSFLVSAYVIDLHSPIVHKRLALAPRVLITEFHRAELANAIFQQVFRRKLSLTDAQLAYGNFEQDGANGVWALTSQPDNSFDTCTILARRHAATLGVRTLDSLHVAAALELGATRFWTFDQRQARLAEAEGLITS